ncbi:MAG: M48 family metalloprotease [Planctomycetota bacterium]|nr:M48 family metalloprotease [Planctomycetota bacterium]MDA0932729.1 M48 family metalloprotease [Planctomycetota bacterium]
MNVSRSFLLGLAAALIAEESFDWLPGEATYAGLIVWAPLMSVPWLWARKTGAVLRREAGTERPPGIALRTALRLQPLTVPLVYLALLGLGGLGALATERAPDSHTLRFALLLAPLLFLEATLRATERRTLAAIEARGGTFPGAIEPTFVGMTVFVVAAVLMFGLALDWISSDRTLEVFVQGTAVGATVGFLAMLGFLAAAMPLLFRLLLPTSTTLPERVADDVRSTAAQLGFPPTRVLSLWTEHRLVNAALVGPLRWPRYLVLTDGILDYLDLTALRGVVAHEVGHARAGHPMLLLVVFAVVPILLVHPASTFDWSQVDEGTLALGGGLVLLLGARGLRALMHRFEFEADQLSATALGGATPCVIALRRVGDLFPSQRGRASFRHPSEEQRVRALWSWDREPAYRDAFLRRGRRMRWTIAALLAAAVVASAWSHVRHIAIDVAVVRLYSGDFRGAEAVLRDVDGPEDIVEPLRAEAAAAASLLPEGGAWDEICQDLADLAWTRGLDELTAGRADEARPYLALATCGRVRDPIRATAWRLIEARLDGEEELASRLAHHLAGLPGADALPAGAFDAD